MLVKKCKHCGQPIDISVSGVKKTSWFHEECYVQHALESTRNKKTKEMLYIEVEMLREETYKKFKRDIDEYKLLKSISEIYGVTMFSKNFILKIRKIESGKESRVFNKVEFSILDEIFNNTGFRKSMLNMPVGANLTGEDKANYDLAVALRRYDSFVKHKKTKSEKELTNIEAKNKIEYFKNNKIDCINKSIENSKSTREEDILF